jgi:OOP family OmpA-OmpF porin
METTAAGERVYAPEFVAALGQDGMVRLSGQVKDAASGTAIASVAASLFGHDRVIDETAVDPQLPEGWPGRVLAGVEALARVRQGKMTVTPATVSVEGWGVEPGLSERVRAQLATKVGDAGTKVDVAFNAKAAEAEALASRPRPEICADQIAAILETDSIRFAQGSADIVPESRGTIAAIADVLRGCPGAEFEIAGHTDSQGNADANQALSETRAEAVVAALEASDLPLVRLHAHGYGAERPVADNATDTGRAQNRRIEFVLAPPGGFREEQVVADAAQPPLDPTTAGCAAEIADILGSESIQFAAGSPTISPESRGTIDRLADALRTCPDVAFEVGGHTDSQGSDSGNQQLSDARARAVLGALRSDDLPLLAMTAKGYGESEPVADNDTEEGRARNRRIAFTLPALAGAAAEAEAADPGDGESLVAQGQSGDPTEVCLERLDALLSENTIEFAPGSAEIAAESASVVNAIAGVLRGCPEAALEVGGHTDSTGSDSGNLELSQSRAEAVLAAVRRKDMPLPDFTAKGYGEADPIADNATAEGRAQNRRIAFTAIGAGGGEEDEGDGSE